MADLREDLRAALLDPAIRASFADLLAPIVVDAVERSTTKSAADRLLTYQQAAEFTGLTYGAFKSRCCIEPELAALALGTGKNKRFRKVDLERYMQARQSRGRRGRRHAATPAEALTAAGG